MNTYKVEFPDDLGAEKSPFALYYNGELIDYRETLGQLLFLLNSDYKDNVEPKLKFQVGDIVQIKEDITIKDKAYRDEKAKGKIGRITSTIKFDQVEFYVKIWELQDVFRFNQYEMIKLVPERRNKNGSKQNKQL